MRCNHETLPAVIANIARLQGCTGGSSAGASEVGRGAAAGWASSFPRRLANNSTMITAKTPTTTPPIVVIQKFGWSGRRAGPLADGSWLMHWRLWVSGRLHCIVPPTQRSGPTHDTRSISSSQCLEPSAIASGDVLRMVRHCQGCRSRRPFRSAHHCHRSFPCRHPSCR